MAGKNDKGMSSAELSSFCGQVALILEAGLPLYDGMETLAEADSGSANAQMYQEVSKGVTETGSLYDALKADKRWPSYLVEMAGVGERSGQRSHLVRAREHHIAQLGGVGAVFDAGALDKVGNLDSGGTGHFAALAVEAILKGIVEENAVLEAVPLAVGPRLLRAAVSWVVGHHRADGLADRTLLALFEIACTYVSFLHS